MSKFGKIDGVVVKELKNCDDVVGEGEHIPEPGFLAEVVRADEGLLTEFGQLNFVVTNRGGIKAFHFHKEQDDIFFVMDGQAKIVLYDSRRESPTYGVTQVIKAGRYPYKAILIPRGVAHGYQVLGKNPVKMVYLTTKVYNRDEPDEGLIPFDNPRIGFDWDIVDWDT